MDCIPLSFGMNRPYIHTWCKPVSNLKCTGQFPDTLDKGCIDFGINKYPFYCSTGLATIKEPA
jgi:hypothetical protein